MAHRLALPLVLILSTIACSGGGDSIAASPTAPSSTGAPASTTAATQATPNLNGRWVGEYSITSCETSGSLAAVIQLCAEDYRVGKEMPIQASWNQTGTDVRGTVTFGSYVSGLEGNTIRGGTLVFNATATQGDYQMASSTTVRSSRDGSIDAGSSVALTMTHSSGGRILIRGSIRQMVRL